jgi:hypothetical protein
MTPPDCGREADVLDAIAAHRWPGRVEPELRAQVAGCESCADVAEVASAIGMDSDAALGETVVLPPAPPARRRS